MHIFNNATTTLKSVSSITYLLLLMCGFVSSLSANDADVLQTQAIQRIDRYSNYFRSTFDRTSLQHELLQAEQELQQSMVLFQAQGNLKQLAYSQVKLGDIKRYLEHWDQAITIYQAAAQQAQQAQADEVRFKALLGIARSQLYGKKNPGLAYQLAQQALLLNQQHEIPANTFDVWDFLAQTHMAQGDYIAAADAMHRAFYVEAAIKDDNLLFYGYLDRADVYQQFAEQCDYQRNFASCLDAAERAKRDYQAAYEVAMKLQWNGLAQQTQKFMQRLEIRKEMIMQQQNLHNQIVQSQIFSPQSLTDVMLSKQFSVTENPQLTGLFAWLEKQGGMPSSTDARGAYIQGLLNAAAGKPDTALEWYLQATALLEQDRGQLHDENSRGSYVEDKVEFYYTAILQLLDQQRVTEAFDLMEQSRSRVMSDLLASKNISLASPAAGKLYADMRQLQGQISQIQSCLYAVRNNRQSDPYCNKIDTSNIPGTTAQRGVTVATDDLTSKQSRMNIPALEALLIQQQSLYQDIRLRMVKETPKLAQLMQSRPVALSSLQQTLAHDESEMLMYLVLESQLLIWHIAADNINVLSVFLPRSILQDKIKQLRKSLVHPKQTYDKKTAHELYLYLIAPVIDQIKSEHIVIVPHEDLNYLPFQALLQHTSGPYLAEKKYISYAPSASILTTLEHLPHLNKPSVLALADPSLLHAPGEVLAIKQRFPAARVITDKLATETDVISGVQDKQLLHFAVHGSFVAEQPLLSYLHLAADQKNDGRLTAAEMYGLNLESARMVVLSACETGNVQATHANEIIGMMRGLIFAGADALLLSAWQIDDQATAAWMQTFYNSLTTEPPAKAASKAMQALQQQANYKHPYYWSPFMLISR